MGIGNNDTLRDPSGSGKKELEVIIEERADSIVESRNTVEAKCVVLVEE